MSPGFSPLIDRLRDSDAYPHAVRDVQVRETHISWVVLTGDYAYKIKKPVRFDFLDFSTLERREFYCHEELRLNRRYAPGVYIDVVPITGSLTQPHVGGHGPPVEYAVQMWRFDDRNLLDRCLTEQRLTADHIDEMAQTLAAFHDQADPASSESRFGHAQLILREARENFSVLKPHRTAATQVARLQQLSEWTEIEAARLAGSFEDRRARGRIRECHGDLHLGNMILHDGNVTFFDGIEFNEELRWIDVMSELAFTVMDFVHRGRTDFGNRLLNAYLERQGDYQGLHVFPFYVVYRALVRAKVDALRLGQASQDEARNSELAGELQGYLELAGEYRRRTDPRIVITCGVSGTGKSTASQVLVDQAGFIRIRSDIERRRMSGIALDEPAAADVGRGLYTEAATRDTYNSLANLVREVISAGYSVVVDATFLRAAHRAQFRQLADTLCVPFHIVAFEEEPLELRRRIVVRSRRGDNASDAGIAVLEHQLRTHEPLSDEDRQFVIDLDELVFGSGG